ncbi:MAG: hypothetical protein AAFU73_17565 [Planctomycetota bacterium]
MGTTWQISRRAGQCAATERPFEDGERHASFLRVEEGALVRVDLSLDAWKEERRRIDAEDDDAEEPLLFWYTRHHVEPKKTVQLDLDSLDRLFLSLEGHASREVRELRYVLCLLLMRKRRVKVEKVLRENGEESFLVKRPRDDHRYTVYVYDFEPERLEELRHQLQAVFDGAEGPEGIRLEAEDEDALEGTTDVEPLAEAGATAVAESLEGTDDPAAVDAEPDADEV